MTYVIIFTPNLKTPVTVSSNKIRNSKLARKWSLWRWHERFSRPIKFYSNSTGKRYLNYIIKMSLISGISLNFHTELVVIKEDRLEGKWLEPHVIAFTSFFWKKKKMNTRYEVNIVFMSYTVTAATCLKMNQVEIRNIISNGILKNDSIHRINKSDKSV